MLSRRLFVNWLVGAAVAVTIGLAQPSWTSRPAPPLPLRAEATAPPGIRLGVWALAPTAALVVARFRSKAG